MEKKEGIKNISLIEAIQPGSVVLKNRAQIKEYVEEPLLEACSDFWDKNIQTLATSANAKDIGSDGYITIEYDSLSTENKKIAMATGNSVEGFHGMRAVKIKVPISQDMTIQEIESKFLKISSKFKKQPMTWAPKYSLQDLRGIFGMNADDNQCGVESFIEFGYFYDQSNELFYVSQDHYEKANPKETYVLGKVVSSKVKKIIL